MKMPPKAQGSYAYWANAPELENPYDVGTAEFAEWQRGWMEASDDDAGDDWPDDEDY